MEDLNSTESLEWTLVLKELAGIATSGLGKELCFNLPLADSKDEAVRIQNQTTEALQLINQEGSIPLGGLRDIRRPLDDLIRGYVLQGTTFLDISSTLRSIRNLKKFITTKLAESSELYLLVFPLYTNQALENEIEHSFASDGSVLDSASPELARIRNSIRNTQQNLRENLNRLVQEARYRNVVQENLVTQRNGRYVIPVKSEAQSQIKGIVQDQSQSGSTVYMEPFSIVEDNNKLALKILEEKNEIERILRELGYKLLPDITLLSESVAKMAEVDVIVAKANYAIALDAKKPYLNDYGLIDLHKVRHPVLVSRKGLENVVPVDILLGKSFDTMIITGSNTGGKTVTLKTLGLCALMVKAGLYLPTKAESDMAFFGSILADIGDEQSLEQNLSTFSGHLLNINKILNTANGGSLVLLDEIGTGTDPSEGAAIAQAIIESLREKNAKIVVTTHYGELKTLAYNFPGISNASVEFDIESLSPTYRLLLGVPGKSNAIHIARRLGVELKTIERARELLKGEEKDISTSIEKLEKEYTRLVEERSRMEKLNISLREQEKIYSIKVNDLEARKKKIKDELYRNFEADINRSLEEVRDIVRELQRDKSSQNAESSRKVIDEISRKVKKKYEIQPARKEPGFTAPIPVNKGDYLFLNKLRQVVQILSEPRDGKVEVQAGSLKLTVDTADLSKVEGKDQKQRVRSLKSHGNSAKVKTVTKPESEGYRNTFNECDLRGMYVAEALEKVDKFLDESSLSGANPVYIIHGKGSGALRTAVREFLQRASYVSSFRTGDLYEGGEGISVVYLNK
jgi:DNA mismatch repair protein MutS2